MALSIAAATSGMLPQAALAPRVRFAALPSKAAGHLKLTREYMSETGCLGEYQVTKQRRSLWFDREPSAWHRNAKSSGGELTTRPPKVTEAGAAAAEAAARARELGTMLSLHLAVIRAKRARASNRPVGVRLSLEQQPKRSTSDHAKLRVFSILMMLRGEGDSSNTLANVEETVGLEAVPSQQVTSAAQTTEAQTGAERAPLTSHRIEVSPDEDLEIQSYPLVVPKVTSHPLPEWELSPQQPMVPQPQLLMLQRGQMAPPRRASLAKRPRQRQSLAIYGKASESEAPRRQTKSARTSRRVPRAVPPRPIRVVKELQDFTKNAIIVGAVVHDVHSKAECAINVLSALQVLPILTAAGTFTPMGFGLTVGYTASVQITKAMWLQAGRIVAKEVGREYLERGLRSGGVSAYKKFWPSGLIRIEFI